MARDLIKTTLSRRNDGRLTADVKLIGWTTEQLERLIFELGGPQGYEIGSTLRRAVDIEQKDHERGLKQTRSATTRHLRRIP